jgi:hypothetical protein
MQVHPICSSYSSFKIFAQSWIPHKIITPRIVLLKLSRMQILKFKGTTRWTKIKVKQNNVARKEGNNWGQTEKAAESEENGKDVERARKMKMNWEFIRKYKEIWTENTKL